MGIKLKIIYGHVCVYLKKNKNEKLMVFTVCLVNGWLHLKTVADVSDRKRTQEIKVLL